jgi:hypothetical protein
MKVAKIQSGQTLVDIALQELGDATRVFEIADLNGIGITADLVAGSTLLVPDYAREKRGIVQVFTNPSNMPASAETVQLDAGGVVVPQEGIEFWAVETDFIVS